VFGTLRGWPGISVLADNKHLSCVVVDILTESAGMAVHRFRDYYWWIEQQTMILHVSDVVGVGAMQRYSSTLHHLAEIAKG